MDAAFLKRLVLGLLIGGGLGFAWHKLVGCRTGACPLTATPLRGIAYGQVEVVVHASRIVQITRSEKLRPQGDAD